MKQNSMKYDPEQVYQPEADTYLLYEAVQAEIRQDDRVIEIGTGSGYIGSHLSGYGSLVVTDINPHACLAAREAGLEVIRCDLLDGIRGLFDLVIFNPPYLPTNAEEKIDDWFEYALDGGPDGRLVITRFVEDVRRIMVPGGRVLLLVSSLTGVQAVLDLIQKHSFKGEIVAKRQVFDEWLYVIKCH